MNLNRIRGGAAAIVVAVLVVLWPAAAFGQSTEPLEIQGIDASGFPLVRAVVSGPALTGGLDDQFVVVEDGTQLAIDVVRLRSEELNVVVAIDVSGSMEGEPLRQAKAAVRGLLDNLPADVPVSVVSFGQTAVVTHDFSTDRASILSAVDGLIAAGGTALFDGIDRSLAQLSAKGGTGALIVLADGNDSTSVVEPAAIVEKLAASGASNDFVALQSPDLDLGTFEFMASAANGSVVTVDQAAQLADTFAQIAAGLSGLYELRWTSQSTGTSGDVSIALASDPATAVTSTFEHSEVRLFVPDVADEIITLPEPTGPLNAAWVPWAAALAVSAGAVVLVTGLRSSEGAVERREERKAEREANKDKRKRAVGGVQERLQGFSAQMLAANNRGRSLDDVLDRAGLAMRSNEFVVTAAAIVLAAMFVGVILVGIPYFLLVGVVAGLGVPLFLRFRMGRRRKAFSAQLGDTLQLMAGSLTAGYGLGQTLDSVARETESPTCDEFQRVVMETRLGRSLEDALDAMSHRIGAEDFDWVVDAIKIQSSVGGNLSDIIQQVGETIRARTRIRRQVDALTAEGKISALVLFVLPIGLLGFILATNPGYISPMFHTGLGQLLLGVAATMLTIGGLWLKKLVTPEF